MQFRIETDPKASTILHLVLSDLAFATSASSAITIVDFCSINRNVMNQKLSVNECLNFHILTYVLNIHISSV